MSDGQTRILIKAGALSRTFRMGSGRGAPSAQVSPLFTSIERETALGAAASPRWQMLETETEIAPWDLCHQLLREGFGFDGAPAVEFAEPDIVQRWIAEPPQRAARKLAAGCGAAEPQNPSFPRVAQGDDPWPRWHHHKNYSQFQAIPNRDRKLDVRVAHVDTGYDPNHSTLPKFLEPQLGRSFVDGDPRDSAVDRSSGLIQNAGHGTGTLSILAGAGVGCAPGLAVVPLRVADSVVLLRSSAIAQAFDYIHALCRDPATFVHVVTMSMGGLASQAWADAVNALYETGVTLVTAAGNNFGNLPTRLIVYPARFNRVTAAAGVMADFRPYTDLGLRLMAGNYGPGQKMSTTIAACTPNVPWARMGCPGIVDSDGAGTSAATPQVAAAAALWIAKNRAAWDAYPHGWQKVEAVRRALFDSAAMTDPEGAMGDATRLGRGRLQASDALALAPRKAAQLTRTPPDSASFAPLRLLTGLGMQGVDAHRQRMLELEALQLSQSPEIEVLLPEGPDQPPEDPVDLRRLAEALADQPGASKALRDALSGASGRTARPVSAMPDLSSRIPGQEKLQRAQVEHAISPEMPKPRRRRLRVFAFDPAMSGQLETLSLNEATLDVVWEQLKPGPVGQYLEVIDIDPASNCAYAPVDLDAPEMLAVNGLSPSEAHPQFHQQMVYAVAMRTIDAFEDALGRVALWAPREVTDSAGRVTTSFVPRLRIHPHALRAANAYYSPDRKALLFGYFRAGADGPAHLPPGGLIFTCLSHDVVAHETTHALLDGLHRRFRIPTNPDVLAFHEAFADIVALFQHFSIPEALQSEIARTRGDLGKQSVLGALAQQFGSGIGGHGALRDFLGGYEERDGEQIWTARQPSRGDYAAARGPHARGAVLVAAVFDAFLQIYRRRGQDLIRLATGGTGVLPEGDIPHDLVRRLTKEASVAASHVLRICIRALDYCPPIDITFGEYLRALITADADVVPEDPLAYRTAFVSAFRSRGIPIEGIAHVSPTSLIWEPPGLQPENGLDELIGRMSLAWKRSADRAEVHELTEENVRKFQRWLRSADNVSDAVLSAIGLRRDTGALSLTVSGTNGRPREVRGTLHPFEVNSVRPARRVTETGEVIADLVVTITQNWTPGDRPQQSFDGGCTLLIDVERARIRYCIRKRVANPRRVGEQLAFVAARQDAPLGATYADDAPRRGEPFAMLHASAPADEV
jgi:hypothetical protein